ncbi:hypothetical protein Scep_016381 [Stephania cephalantha]|uniref:Uncharacterized protein n=1 Tax=Stephania cephalantha TaxID=152367 RepID=A0AAP0IMI8_9MAGN
MQIDGDYSYALCFTLLIASNDFLRASTKATHRERFFCNPCPGESLAQFYFLSSIY